MTNQKEMTRLEEIQEGLLNANVGCLLLFVLVFGIPLVGIGGFFVGLGINTMRDQARLNSKAIPVPATIVSSEIQRTTTSTGPGPGEHMTTFWPDVEFSYQDADGSRSSTTVWPVAEGGSEEWARAVVEKYPSGAEVSAFVDPDNPDMAFLEKRWSQMPYLSMIAGCLPAALIAGLGILLAGWKRPRLALSIALLTGAAVLCIAGLATEHHVRTMPAGERPWWIVLVVALSLPMAWVPLAAVVWAKYLHRQYLAAMQQQRQAGGLE